MRSKEEILKKGKERISDLEYFDRMIGLNDKQRADLELLKELVVLVEAQTQWIPCSSGQLPKEKEEVLISVDGRAVYKAFIVPGKPYFYCYEMDMKLDSGEATAWMPLPPVYKEN